MNFCTTCGRGKAGSERYCTTCGTPYPEAGSPPDPGPGLLPETVARAKVPPHHPPPGSTGPGGTGPGGTDRQQPARSWGKKTAAVVATLAIAIVAAGVGVAIVYSRDHKGTPASLPLITSSSSAPPATPPASSSPSVPSVPLVSSSPSAQATTATTAQGQAGAVSTLLSSSAQSRLAWNSAALITDVGQCVNLANDIQQIRQIAAERMSEYNQAQNLQTDAIQNGTELKTELTRVLLISLNIDREFLKWARQQQSSGCTAGTSSPYYQEANTSDTTANNDKATFVSTWNPVARQYGLQQFTADQI